MKSAANNFYALTISLVVMQVLLQICLKGALSDMWSLLFSMQLSCYLEIYNVPMPGSNKVFNVEFLKLIEFEILKPEGMIKIFNPEFSLKNFLTGKN